MRIYMSPSLRRKIYNRYEGKCCKCNELTRFFGSLYDSPFVNKPKAGSVDHIVPVSKGGTNDESNLQWMCRSCNCAKGART